MVGFLVAVTSQAVQSEEPEFLKGTVHEVVDGDTIVFCPKIEGECKLSERYKVDLWGIDAPEVVPRKQFHAQKAKEYLEQVVDSSIVVLEVKEKNEEGQIFAKVFVVGHEHSNLNVHLLMEGHAWSIVEEDSAAAEYELAEAYARERKIGLWREIEPIAPWTWRESHENEKIAN